MGSIPADGRPESSTEGKAVSTQQGAHRVYTVGQAARLAGVTARTLHHYEHIGLLTPAARSSADYRLYSDADLDRLTRVLYYRELGFPLEDIATLIGDGLAEATIAAHLDRQHQLLTERLVRIQAMVAAIEKERNAMTMGTPLTPEEKLEIFGSDYDPSWEAEAEQRWGATDAWQQSAERAKGFSKADWKRFKADGDVWNEQAVAAFRSGAAPDSPAALELAEQHRAMVSQQYDCTYAMQRQLADMFVADSRFAQTYDDLAAGLAQWVHDAIHANADQHPDAQGTGFC